MVGKIFNGFITFCDDSNDLTFPGFDLFDVGDHLFIGAAAGCNENAGLDYQAGGFSDSE